MSPRFFYFDFGNVLVNFSNARACRQIGELTGVAPERVRAVLYESGLKERGEAGQLDNEQLLDALCKELKAQPDRAALRRAFNDIFDLNSAVLPLVVHLEAAGCRLGLLSNICEGHWKFVSDGRFGLLPRAFEVLALSFQIGAVKPDPKIFHAAAELAGTPPAEIFFVDDVPGHVAAARQVGFDAVLYTTADALGKELRKRGVRMNY